MDINNFRGHIDAGRKIESIKMLRQVSGIGLKESKELVEDVMSSGDYTKVKVFFEDEDDTSAIFQFDAASVTFMPPASVKVDGVLTAREWRKLDSILKILSPKYWT